MNGVEPAVEGTPEEERKRRLWRQRWRSAVGNGVTNFRARVCGLTGLLCDKKEV